MRLRVGVLLALGLILATALPARGHGELQGSDPAADSVVKKAPDSVSITLTEAPGPGTQVRVADGCNQNVVVDLTRSGETVKLDLRKGQPGTWDVRYRVVSAVDGHTSLGTFDFKVRGRRDCSPTKTPSPKDEIDGGQNTIIESDDPPDTGGFPFVPFAIASVVIIGLAFVLRRAASR